MELKAWEGHSKKELTSSSKGELDYKLFILLCLYNTNRFLRDYVNKALVKFLSSFIFCNVYRLIRFFPNNDPIMAFILPYSRTEKWWKPVLFAVITMVVFDLITFRVGLWTVGTALTYGLIALLFVKFFRHKKASMKKYLGGGVFGILLFDFITGPIMSSFFFKMPFYVAFLGQIPFTVMHLFSGIILISIIAPIVDPDLRKSLSKQITHQIYKVKEIISVYGRF